MFNTLKLTAGLALVLALCLAGMGCMGVVAKPVMGAVTGAKASFQPLGPIEPVAGAFTEVAIEPFGNDVPNLVPEEFPGLVAGELTKSADGGKLLAKAPAGAARKVLTIRGRYIQYQPKAEAVARIELVDTDANKVFATANCVSHGDTMTNRGTGSLAKGLAKAIRKFVRKTTKAGVEGEED